MARHVCPQEICDRFGQGEEIEALARRDAFEWLKKQVIRKGDEVLMPDSKGVYQMFVADHDISVN